MLMQNFKSAADLEITEQQKDALIKTLVLMETGKLIHIPVGDVSVHCNGRGGSPNKLFNMSVSYGIADCGTVGCIRGTAERVSDARFEVIDLPGGLRKLFYSGKAIGLDANLDQAATALRSYLTTGDARWDLALA